MMAIRLPKDRLYCYKQGIYIKIIINKKATKGILPLVAFLLCYLT